MYGIVVLHFSVIQSVSIGHRPVFNIHWRGFTGKNVILFFSQLIISSGVYTLYSGSLTQLKYGIIFD